MGNRVNTWNNFVWWQGWIYRGDHFVMYIKVELLHCILDTNRVRQYTSRKTIHENFLVSGIDHVPALGM